MTKTTEIGTVIRPAMERDPAGACRWLAERATPWRTSAPDVRRRACRVGADAGRDVTGISRVDGWGESPAETGTLGARG